MSIKKKIVDETTIITIGATKIKKVKIGRIDCQNKIIEEEKDPV